MRIPFFNNQLSKLRMHLVCIALNLDAMQSCVGKRHVCVPTLCNVDGLPHEPYDFRCMKPCVALTLSAWLTLVALAQTSPIATFRPAGTVPDEAGQAAPGNLTDAYDWASVASLMATKIESVPQTAKTEASLAQEPVKVAATTHTRPELGTRRLATPGLEVAGRVVDLYDRPVAGARVSLTGEGQVDSTTYTDGNGWFRFNNVHEGKVKLFAFAGLRDPVAPTEAMAGDTNVVILVGEQVGHPSGVTTSKVLKGIVTDLAGRPAAGAQVTAFPSWPVRWVNTGTNGRFAFIWNFQPWPRNGFGARLVARDTNSNLIAAMEIPPNGTNLEIQLREGVTITGRVKDENGRPKRNVRVWLNLLAGTQGNRVIERFITTDARGYFEVGPVPRGCEYSVSLNPSGYSQHNRKVIIGADSASRVELAPFILKRANLKITGRVLNEQDQPVIGAHVSLSENGLSISSTQTDKAGRFVFKQVWGGKFWIGVLADGYAVTNFLTVPTNNIEIRLTRIRLP